MLEVSHSQILTHAFQAVLNADVISGLYGIGVSLSFNLRLSITTPITVKGKSSISRGQTFMNVSRGSLLSRANAPALAANVGLMQNDAIVAERLELQPLDPRNQDVCIVTFLDEQKHSTNSG